MLTPFADHAVPWATHAEVAAGKRFRIEIPALVPVVFHGCFVNRIGFEYINTFVLGNRLALPVEIRRDILEMVRDDTQTLIAYRWMEKPKVGDQLAFQTEIVAGA